jgi:hypothetical protein
MKTKNSKAFHTAYGEVPIGKHGGLLLPVQVLLVHYQQIRSTSCRFRHQKMSSHGAIDGRPPSSAGIPTDLDT